TKNHACRMGAFRLNGRRLRPRYPVKCVNPVAEGVSSNKMRGIYPYYGASGIVDYVNDYIFDEDLILLGEDGENILSRNMPLVFRVSGKTWVNNHAHVLRPTINCHIGYLTEYLESLDFSIFNSGTAQPKLNKKSCIRLPVVLPPLPEQRAIADALSDADALIAALDAMIAKKRDLKQAVMQQLLTGKTRLVGFTKEWRRLELGSVAKFYKGKGLPKSAISRTGAHPCIHYGELFTHYGVLINTILSRTDFNVGSLTSRRNDVLMPTSDVTPVPIRLTQTPTRASGPRHGGH
uniref:restriction endonuclease subunit S n=1 Tax=Acidiphilium sp. TaxID=527 RepID=UPI002589DDCA